MHLNDELVRYLQSHSVPDAGIQWITNAINSEPARRVQGGYSRNSIYTFPSRKTRLSLQAESRLEYRYLIETEYSTDTLLVFDQPGSIYISRHTKSGRKTHRYYVPDYLVFSKERGPFVVEVKSIGKLRDLCSTLPFDWLSNGSEFIYRPAADALKPLGLNHVVVHEHHLNPTRNANLRLLLTLRDSLGDQSYDIGAIKTELTKMLCRTSAITLLELANQLGLIELTPLLRLIDCGFLYADLDNSLLSLPSAILVSTEPAIVHALQQSTYQPLLLQKAQNNEASCVDLPSMASLSTATKYLEQIKEGKSSRNLYRIKAKIKVGLHEGKPALIAAAPNYKGRGNRRDHIGPAHRDFIQEAISRYYCSPERRSCHGAFNSYKARLERSQLTFPPISEPTFRQLVKKLHPDLVGLARGGRRLRNTLASPTPVHTRAVSAELPFAVASIDHHEIDIQFVVAESIRKKFTARIWLTALVDHGSKCILSIWISFNSPSRKSVGMVLRECVRTFGGLPRVIHTDGGPEFRCDFLKQLYAYFNGTVCQRPKADGRSGSEVERPFGLLKTEWAAHRAGYISSIKDSRAISTTHSAENQAELTIHQGWEEVCLFREHHNNRRIGDMESPPLAIVHDGIRRYPSVMIKQELTDEFIVFSSVDCCEFALDRQRGIHIGNRWFSHPKLFDPSLTKSSLTVRIDPENPYKIYAEINNQWVACLSRGHDEFLMLPRAERESTAFRMLLGHAAREQARKDDQVNFVGKLHILDEQRKAEALGAATLQPPDIMREEAGTEASNLFDLARQQTLLPINTVTHPSRRN